MRFVKNKREIVIVYLYIRRTILTFTPFFDTSSYFNKKKLTLQKSSVKVSAVPLGNTTKS